MGWINPETKKAGCHRARKVPGRRRQVGIVVVESMGKNARKNDDETRKENYLKKLRKDQQVGEKLPVGNEDYFAKLLFLQIQGSIYPHYGEDFLQSVEEPVLELLKLHMGRLEFQPEIAFQTVSRAVQMVQGYLGRHENAYVYDILTWLRKNGCRKHREKSIIW